MNESDNRDTNFDNGTNETFIISDTSSALNGTFSFNHLKQNNIRTKRYASSLASPLAENSAIGIILSYIDTTQVDPDKRLSSEVKTTLGYSLVYSKKVTFGLVYTDAARADKDDQFFIGGFQLEVSDNFHLLLDAGFNPNYAVESKSLHSFAAQINFVSDFFLRAGQFYNNSTKLKGYAWGLSWVGPKLSLDYAFRNSEATTGTGSLLLSEEELHEHSFAMSVRF